MEFVLQMNIYSVYICVCVFEEGIGDVSEGFKNGNSKIKLLQILAVTEILISCVIVIAIPIAIIIVYIS